MLEPLFAKIYNRRNAALARIAVEILVRPNLSTLVFDALPPMRQSMAELVRLIGSEERRLQDELSSLEMCYMVKAHESCGRRLDV